MSVWPTLCRTPGCCAITYNGLCDACRRGRDAERPNSAQRGYDGTWRKVRLLVLHEQPLCVRCAERGHVTAATDVDHIVPLAAGGTHDRENLQPLCHACHARKTATEDGGFGRVQRNI